MTMTPAGLAEWLALGERIVTTGQAALNAVLTAAAAHGIEQDTAALNADISDAERRKTIAEREAGADTGSDVPGGGAV